MKPGTDCSPTRGTLASPVGKRLGWEGQGQEKSIEFENCSRWMSRCIVHHASRKHTRTQVAKLRNTLHHRPPAKQVVHGTGSSDRILVGQCSRTRHMATRWCWNHTSFVNESALATAVGTTRSGHGWSLYIRREPRRLADKVITCSQTATAAWCWAEMTIR